jgi:hypothetical protein
MSYMLEMMWLIVGVVVAINVWVSVLVFRDEFPSGAQRIGQCVLIWLFPILGALLVLATQSKTLKRGSGKYPQAHPEVDDFGASGQSVSAFKSGYHSAEESISHEP